MHGGSRVEGAAGRVDAAIDAGNKGTDLHALALNCGCHRRLHSLIYRPRLEVISLKEMVGSFLGPMRYRLQNSVNT